MNNNIREKEEKLLLTLLDKALENPTYDNVHLWAFTREVISAKRVMRRVLESSLKGLD